MKSYDDYRTELERSLSPKSFATQRQFARDVLRQFLPYVENADKSGQWDEELKLIEMLADTVRSGEFSIAAIEAALRRFHELAQEDEVHATETDSDIVDFLCALESFVALECKQDSHAAAHISESLMNILDRYFTDDTPLSEWLRTPEIRKEFDRQLAVLAQLA
jgi:hypothetical protein